MSRKLTKALGPDCLVPIPTLTGTKPVKLSRSICAGLEGGEPKRRITVSKQTFRKAQYQRQIEEEGWEGERKRAGHFI